MEYTYVVNDDNEPQSGGGLDTDRNHGLPSGDENSSFGWPTVNKNLVESPRTGSKVLYDQDASTVLGLSGGTDFQGFQGVYRVFHERENRSKKLFPRWLSYECSVQDSELGGAFFFLEYLGVRGSYFKQNFHIEPSINLFFLLVFDLVRRRSPCFSFFPLQK